MFSLTTCPVAAAEICSLKISVLKNFAKFSGKHLRWSLLLILIKLQPAAVQRKDSSTGFFNEFCEIFKNTFKERLRTIASRCFFMFQISPTVNIFRVLQPEIIRKLNIFHQRFIFRSTVRQCFCQSLIACSCLICHIFLQSLNLSSACVCCYQILWNIPQEI